MLFLNRMAGEVSRILRLTNTLTVQQGRCCLWPCSIMYMTSGRPGSRVCVWAERRNGSLSDTHVRAVSTSPLHGAVQHTPDKSVQAFIYSLSCARTHTHTLLYKKNRNAASQREKSQRSMADCRRYANFSVTQCFIILLLIEEVLFNIRQTIAHVMSSIPRECMNW